MNPGEKHIACVVLVDISGSMSRDGAIDELNQGLQAFKQALQEDAMACGCTDVSLISFGTEVRELVPFCPAADFQPPYLSAGGLTAMNEAIITGLDSIDLRKTEYKNVGVPYWRPWIFLLTDGIPTDDELHTAALDRLRDAVDRKKITFFPMGIGAGADIPYLKQYTKDGAGAVLKASKDNFKEAFVWLSNSMSVISNSNPSTTSLELPPLPASIVIDL